MNDLVTAIGAGCSIIIAQVVATPNQDTFEKFTLGGILAWVLYVVLNRQAKALEKVGEALDMLSKEVSQNKCKSKE